MMDFWSANFPWPTQSARPLYLIIIKLIAIKTNLVFTFIIEWFITCLRFPFFIIMPDFKKKSTIILDNIKILSKIIKKTKPIVHIYNKKELQFEVLSFYFWAIASTSTNAFAGNSRTATADRAGKH